VFGAIGKFTIIPEQFVKTTTTIPLVCSKGSYLYEFQCFIAPAWYCLAGLNGNEWVQELGGSAGVLLTQAALNS
jgi:hypothetical protein